MKPFNLHFDRFFDLEVPDFGHRRANTQLALEAIELMEGSDGDHLDPAVFQIASPAADAEIPCGSLREIAVTHSLNLPGDVVPPR